MFPSSVHTSPKPMVCRKLPADFLKAIGIAVCSRTTVSTLWRSARMYMTGNILSCVHDIVLGPAHRSKNSALNPSQLLLMDPGSRCMPGHSLTWGSGRPQSHSTARFDFYVLARRAELGTLLHIFCVPMAFRLITVTLMTFGDKRVLLGCDRYCLS